MRVSLRIALSTAWAVACVVAGIPVLAFAPIPLGKANHFVSAKFRSKSD